VRQTDRRTNDETDAPARRLVRRIFHWASADGVFSECRSHSADLCRTTDCSSLPAAMNRKHGRRRPITSSPCADGILCAIICPLILILDPSRGPIGDLKKTWVDIPDVGQKSVIQDGVQDGRRTLTSNITPSASVSEWWIWCLYVGFGGRGIHWNHFQGEKSSG